METSPLLRLLFAAAGIAFVGAGFLLGVRSAEITSRPPHRRPRWWHRPAARAGWTALRVGSTLAGFALAAAGHPAVALVLAGLLLGLWARRRWVRGRRFQVAMLRAAFVDLCKQQPGVSREDLLAFLIRARHPKWDPEMVAGMVRDHRSVDALLHALVRLERQVLD